MPRVPAPHDIDSARSGGATGTDASPVGSPYAEFDRDTWSRLRASTPLTLTEDDLDRLSGLGDRIDLREVEEVYLPLSRLSSLYVAGHRGPARRDLDVPRRGAPTAPRSCIGIAGSVAVGKSTTARILRELLSRWPGTPAGRARHHRRLPAARTPSSSGAACCSARASPSPTTGGRCCGSSSRSSPASTRSGRRSTRTCPTTSCPAPSVVVRRPDVLIVEGLNVLQPARSGVDGRQGVAVSDFFDFSLYVDARTERRPRAGTSQRFLRLRETAFSRPESYFHRYASLSDEEAVRTRRAHLDDDQRAATSWRTSCRPGRGRPWC